MPSELAQRNGPVDAELVRAATRALPAPDALADLADVLALLADPTRLRLLLALRGAGELCVGDLASVVGHTESAVSHALRLLRAHRVVAARRASRLVYYRLADEHVTEVLGLAVAHLGHVALEHPERHR